jgi:hypothetical protein
LARNNLSTAVKELNGSGKNLEHPPKDGNGILKITLPFHLAKQKMQNFEAQSPEFLTVHPFEGHLYCKLVHLLHVSETVALMLSLLAYLSKHHHQAMPFYCGYSSTVHLKPGEKIALIIP